MSEFGDWPPELLARIIKAMCPETVCRTCGEPRRRIVGEPEYVDRRGISRPAVDLPAGRGTIAGRQLTRGSRDGNASWSEIRQAPTLGFSDCGHDNWRRGVVLDPFGTGGTAEVTEALSRVGIEIPFSRDGAKE